MVLAMEVVEHVADVNLFVKLVAAMVKPSGLMIAATLNRTLKSFALAIVGAEYILRWLPRGTHRWTSSSRRTSSRSRLISAASRSSTRPAWSIIRSPISGGSPAIPM